MMNEQETYDWVDQYLDGELTDAERSEFEKRVQENSALKALLLDQVNIRQAAFWAVKEDYAETFASWRDDMSKQAPTIPVFRRPAFLMVAAFFLLLIVSIGIFQWLPPHSMDRLYIDYISPLPSDQYRGEQAFPEAKRLISTGMKLYIEKQYADAGTVFEQVLDLLPDSLHSQPYLYLGTCYLLDGQSEQALFYFSQVDKRSQASFEAEWYTALTYVQRHEKEQAQEALTLILQSPTHPRRMQAEALLQQLNRL